MNATSGSSTIDTIPLSADTLKLLITRVRDYAIFMLDPTGKVASWNDGAERIKGYRAEEIIGQHFSVFYEPADAKREHPQQLLAQARSEGRVEDEGWRVRKDGKRFWADVVITAVHDDAGQLIGFAKVTRDLTERRAAERSLSELAGRLVAVQDDERRRIGRELHDATSPLLASLTGKLHAVRQRARTANLDVATLVNDALSLAETAGTMVRAMSAQLDPPLLDSGGLLPAVRWYLEAWTARTGQVVNVTLPEHMSRIARDREAALFRIVQEWLNLAIGKSATITRLRLEERSDAIELAVTTAGGEWSGATAERLRTSPGDLGITAATVTERARRLGGSLRFRNTGNGLELIATLPTRSTRGSTP